MRGKKATSELKKNPLSTGEGVEGEGNLSYLVIQN
jgi:hypothetical protein